MRPARYGTLVASSFGAIAVYAMALAMRVLGHQTLAAPSTLELTLWLLGAIGVAVFAATTWALTATAESREYAARARKLACAVTRNARRAASINALGALIVVTFAALALARVILLREFAVVPLTLVWLEVVAFVTSTFAYRSRPRRAPPPQLSPDDEGVVIVVDNG